MSHFAQRHALCQAETHRTAPTPPCLRGSPAPARSQPVTSPHLEGGAHRQGQASRLCTITHLPSHTGHPSSPRTAPRPPWHTTSRASTAPHPPLQLFVASPSPGPGWPGGGVQRAAGEEVDSPSWRVTPCGIFKLFPHLLNEAFALAPSRSGCSFHGGGAGKRWPDRCLRDCG